MSDIKIFTFISTLTRILYGVKIFNVILGASKEKTLVVLYMYFKIPKSVICNLIQNALSLGSTATIIFLGQTPQNMIC